ncbi:MAG: hypothetical protein K8J31_05565 [Anaerolineae bacterium]|nr:hypothetical protein [Anaerolineae bacterium]
MLNRLKLILTGWLLLGLLAACASKSSQILPTLAVLPTSTPTPASPTPVVIPVGTSEQVSPLGVVTVEAAYVLITPTDPPSKTPTQTETPTATPTHTPEPTEPTTATATSTALIPPTRVMPFVTAVMAQSSNRVCDSTWFFILPRPDHCPATRATTSQAVFQEFENGLMIWIQHEDTIYVMYHDFAPPAWESFEDQFEEGMPEVDESWELPPSPELFQPHRGFGMLWRGNPIVRARIGWALDEWEVPFSSTVQTGEDDAIFLQDPYGGVVVLMPGQRDWARYLGDGRATRLELELIPTLTATP